MPKTERYMIRLEPSQEARLIKEQTKTGATIAELIRRAIDKAYPPKVKP